MVRSKKETCWMLSFLCWIQDCVMHSAELMISGWIVLHRSSSGGWILDFASLLSVLFLLLIHPLGNLCDFETTLPNTWI